MLPTPPAARDADFNSLRRHNGAYSVSSSSSSPTNLTRSPSHACTRAHAQNAPVPDAIASGIAALCVQPSLLALCPMPPSSFAQVSRRLPTAATVVHCRRTAPCRGQRRCTGELGRPAGIGSSRCGLGRAGALPSVCVRGWSGFLGGQEGAGGGWVEREMGGYAGCSRRSRQSDVTRLNTEDRTTSGPDV